MIKTSLYFSILVTAGLLNLRIQSSLADQPVQKLQVRFYCGQSFDISSNKILPTTFAATSARTEPVALIRWNSHLSSYKPQTRCDLVSQKFQTAWSGGKLHFISAGISQKTGQGIICGTANKTQKCDESQMLFTLKNSKDAGDIVTKIGQIQRGADSSPITQSSSNEYIDLEELLK